MKKNVEFCTKADVYKGPVGGERKETTILLKVFMECGSVYYCSKKGYPTIGNSRHFYKVSSVVEGAANKNLGDLLCDIGEIFTVTRSPNGNYPNSEKRDTKGV